MKTQNDITITQTNGNSTNRIRGSRVTIWRGDSIIDRFVVPTYNAQEYCVKHPNGVYGRRFAAAINATGEKQ